MHFIPATLSLITTHVCTAGCEHCCFSCNPDKSLPSIPQGVLEQLIDEANVECRRLVVFTGGECFLLGRRLEALIARATDHGLYTRCVSNGYWGTSMDAARARAKRVHDAGLREINFSTGVEHGEWVPTARVANAARACLELGMTVAITVESTEQRTAVYDEITALMADAPAGGLLSIFQNVWIEMEGDRALTYDDSFNLMQRTEPCKTILDTVAITPTLDVNACCGLHQERVDAITLGNLSEHNLTQILRGAPDDLLKMWLAVEGPEAMLREAKRQFPDIEIPAFTAHPCEACKFLFDHPDVEAAVIESARALEDQLIDTYITHLATKRMLLNALEEKKPQQKRRATPLTVLNV